MSGDPPHHPHNRPWDYMTIPNWRQPQHAHMAHKHSILHQPNWHPPTTESMKVLGQLPHNFALHQMFENLPPLANQSSGVDLTLAGQNGEATGSLVSLTVKDSKKIGSNPQTKECTATRSKMPESMQADSVVRPGDPKVPKRASPLDSVLERLKPSYVNAAERTIEFTRIPKITSDTAQRVDGILPVNQGDKLPGVIVPSLGTQDEISDSSTLHPVSSREEDTISPYNTEDSLDGNKSRRKRKPCKTLRCSKNEDKIPIELDAPVNLERPEIIHSVNAVDICLVSDEKNSTTEISEASISSNVERRRSSSLDLNVVPAKTRRKTSSESETIDNIAAMIQEGLKEKELLKIDNENVTDAINDITFVPVSVIKTKDEIKESAICQESTISESTTKISTIVTPAQKKETHFVEIENKLEEMFAGIEDTTDPLRTDDANLEDAKIEDPLLDEAVVASTSQDNVSSTSNDISSSKPSPKPRKRSNAGKNIKKVESCAGTVDTPGKKSTPVKNAKLTRSSKNQKKVVGKTTVLSSKSETAKEASYDSSSNASSVKSRGPFVHIKGPRNSPVSVNVVNTPSNEDDIEKKIRSKKFHDDSEYRHKVRSKGLHCSTLSHKYDAQTRDATWICVFCKKGPHTSEIPGSLIRSIRSYPTGDLFGPYFISGNCEEYNRRLEDPFDKQFRSKKVIRTLEAPKGSFLKKSKRKLSEGEGESSDPHLGIVETSNNNFEVWVHEECLVWSPGVYLVGPKIIGLQEAVWSSCNVVCTRCNYKGANICCLYRGCLKMAHVWCAKLMEWNFEEESFKTFCGEHQKTGEKG
ncbi:hypothetical protein WA026_001185 [Henosepilachna vigintioctopunctata]|uniref:PHD-type domain-containing protein n=1 Tax=Henosepilachna vigintioctopunctata TaxID=420089 RepID=A0AAW1UQ82_9CUCU